MIIKKSKGNGSNPSENPDDKKAPEPQKAQAQEINTGFPDFPVFKERQERRRGDRRRGYRRVDDRNLISRAHEEASSIKEKAAGEGFEYGIKQSKEQLVTLNQAITGFLNAKEQAMQNAAGDIADIAIKVAEKIIKTEVACDETIVLSIVSDVLKQIGKDESRIIIKTNPSDTQIVRENLPKIFPYGSANAKILVMDDNNVEWGSCIIETSNGMIDASFATQLEILRKAFEAGM